MLHKNLSTSSTDAFVAATRPAAASSPSAATRPTATRTGKSSRAGKRAGAQVLTTGERGMVTVSTDGVDLKVETFVRP